MKKILIVDKSDTIRLYVRLFLRGLIGMSVFEATDGLVAMNKLDKDKFDLIITDLCVPNLSGLELIRHARERLGLKTPIIIISSEGDCPEVEHGLALGANEFVIKPLVRSTFTDTVMQYMR